MSSVTVKKFVLDCAAVGIPTTLKAETVSAFSAVSVAVLMHAKTHGAVIRAMRAAKAAAYADPAYAIPASGGATAVDTGKIAQDLARILTGVYNTHRAGVEAAAVKAKLTGPESTAWIRENTRSVLGACDHAKSEIVTLLGGSGQTRVVYDSKAKQYAITAAPSPGPDGSKPSARPATVKADAGKADAGKADKAKPSAGRAESDPGSDVLKMLDSAPGAAHAILRAGALSASLRRTFGETPDAARCEILALAMELEARMLALQPGKAAKKAK